MKTILARIGLAGMIAVSGLSGLVAMAPAAHAQDVGVEFRFGDDNDGPRRDRGWQGRDVENREWDRGRDWRRDRDRDWRRPRGCFPGQAVDKARGQGLRHARIGNITPRTVVVIGRGPYGPDRMIFANVRGCPLID